MTPRIACPNPVCPYPHDVQKVSVVVQSNTATYANVQTALAQKLSAPQEPIAPFRPKYYFDGSEVAGYALGGAFIGFIGSLLYTISSGFNLYFFSKTSSFISSALLSDWQ